MASVRGLGVLIGAECSSWISLRGQILAALEHYRPIAESNREDAGLAILRDQKGEQCSTHSSERQGSRADTGTAGTSASADAKVEPGESAAKIAETLGANDEASS